MAKNQVAKQGGGVPASTGKSNTSLTSASRTVSHKETYEPNKVTVEDTVSETVTTVTSSTK